MGYGIALFVIPPLFLIILCILFIIILLTFGLGLVWTKRSFVRAIAPFNYPKFIIFFIIAIPAIWFTVNMFFWGELLRFDTIQLI